MTEEFITAAEMSLVQETGMYLFDTVVPSLYPVGSTLYLYCPLSVDALGVPRCVRLIVVSRSQYPLTATRHHYLYQVHCEFDK